MADTHTCEVTVEWTGNLGTGTDGYRTFNRAHEVLADGKPPVAASAAPAFLGDPARWNPEELLVASLSQCHMLWYLHLCAVGGVVVVDYEDHPRGTLETDPDGGGGRFTQVVLRPEVTVSAVSMEERALALHAEVPALCFIARSVSFPVRHEPRISALSPPGAGPE